MAESGTSKDKSRIDQLIEAMPRIAEAVKAFPESVQPKAFDLLMAELRGTSVPVDQTLVIRTPAGGRARQKATRAVEKEGKRRRVGGPTALRDLDLAPTGKKSLKAFVQDKQPKTQHDKNATAVYYLRETLGITKVTVDHVFTAYKDMGWREPGNLANSLALTASRKRFLDTASLDDIKLTPPGRNHVSQDLPAPKKAR